MTLKTELKDIFTKNLRTSGIYIAFVLIVVLFTIMTDGLLLSPINLTNIILQYSYVLILALGMIMVIVAGHIDLSVGSLVALTGAVSAVLVIKTGAPWWVGILAAVAVGALCGVWQGFWVAYVGIPAFIVTLAGMLLFRGLTYEVLNNVSLSPFPGEYQQVAGGFLNGLLGGYGFDMFTVLIGVVAVAGLVWSQYSTRRGRVKFGQDVESMAMFIAKNALSAIVILWFFWQISISRGMPIVLMILGVLVIAYHVLTTRTVFGRHIYAIGGNLSAARLSGVNVKKVNFWIFINMGMLAGVAGAVFSSRSNGAQPGAGNMFELDAIAACFIGGASTTGGVGRVTGAIVGGLVMAVLSNGMQLMGVGASAQQIVKGLVLLLAVAFDIYNKRRAGEAS
ncbi:multiple monosaccharide ABC transporter permease [Glutamicibacter bergerei]|jgi:putative multiple sugar transport system permease protein|uniref:Xylose transport system permease protein XylH n=2 Tax=Glutamicibacter TaxID=1742989 RepID=A0ABV9MMZ2_9MICC|nr:MULTISPECIES: multiple monosaccharide ABC transporter permease [Glutamicibacter]PCC36071.1 ABC transporter permease [Glutamicibacter sp. BW77]GGJ51484.1 ABC transporter permease [Glutamicibacter ardleyensis]HBV10772.1 sugar ABC transporter permease [Micrococcaceae bacterium]